MVDFDSSNVKFAERFALALGSRTGQWLHEQTGIPTSTLSNYRKRGLIPAGDAACKIALALGVSVYWLVLGVGEMNGQQGKFVEANKALDAEALQNALSIVDEWLLNTGRVMDPRKKAGVVTEIYSLLLEDTRGSTPFPEQINRILRLVG